MGNIENREVCRDKDICGGCVYQGVPYEEQLSNKFGEVKGLLDKKDIRYGSSNITNAVSIMNEAVSSIRGDE